MKINSTACKWYNASPLCDPQHYVSAARSVDSLLRTAMISLCILLVSCWARVSGRSCPLCARSATLRSRARRCRTTFHPGRTSVCPKPHYLQQICVGQLLRSLAKPLPLPLLILNLFRQCATSRRLRLLLSFQSFDSGGDAWGSSLLLRLRARSNGLPTGRRW